MPEGEAVILRSVDARKLQLSMYELSGILRKLQNDYDAVVLIMPDRLHIHSTDEFIVNLFDEFESFYEETVIAPRQSLDKAIQQQEVQQKVYNPTESEKQQWIEFDPFKGEILLNGTILISKPQYDSENYKFFEYINQNPNRRITLAEMNENIEGGINKPLYKILENLNFTGELRQAFFNTGNGSIMFKPKRTIEELKREKLHPLRLFSQKK